MKRIDDKTVELTETEAVIREIHALLVDQGYTQGGALMLMRGSSVPENLRSPTRLLDAALTPEFVAFLAEQP